MTNVNDLLHRAASGLGEHASDCPDCHATARDIDEYLDLMEQGIPVPDGIEFPLVLDAQGWNSWWRERDNQIVASRDRLTRLEGVVRGLAETMLLETPALRRECVIDLLERLRDLKEAE